jgi:very-short-patch-repair endonuclease
MLLVADVVRARGGIAATHELLSASFTPGQILGAVRKGSITRVRKGWYANTDLNRDVLRAWRVGGQLACVSAAAYHHLWVPELPEEPLDALHVSVRPLSARLRRPTDHRARLADAEEDHTRVHWSAEDSGDRTAVSVATAIQQVFRCQPLDVGFVVLESALNQHRLDTFDRIEVFEQIPTRARRLVRLTGDLSESGTESMVKLMLLRLMIPFRQQVVIDGVGRVDFVVGDRLVIEVDSKEHHGDAYRDRKRDALLSIAGYRVLRFMYSQIVHEPQQVRAAILSALARSDHNRA